MSGSWLIRVLGGSPLPVMLRLLVVSFVVGSVMAWLDIDPVDLAAGLERIVAEAYANGFEALHRLGRYAVAGAVVVVPVWVVVRVLSLGAARPRADPLPGGPHDNTRTETTGWRRNGPASAS